MHGEAAKQRITHGCEGTVNGDYVGDSGLLMIFGGVWLSLARAPGLGPGGRRFESCHPELCAKVSLNVFIYRVLVAQLDRATAF